jgi:hypothetical protein
MTSPSEQVREILEKAEKATQGEWSCSRDLSTFEVYVENKDNTSICKLNPQDSEYNEDLWPWSDAEYLTVCSPHNLTPLLKLMQSMAEALEFYGDRTQYGVSQYFVESVDVKEGVITFGSPTYVVGKKVVEDQGKRAADVLTKWNGK